MLDNPEKTNRLLAALMASLPFEVELTPMLVQHLQTQNVDIGDENRYTVSGISYAGDEGGIVCHIVPPDGAAVLVVSLTHVRIPRSMPLAAAVVDYQKHRVKRLRRQGRA